MKEKFYKFLRIKVTVIAIIVVFLFLAVQLPFVKRVIARQVINHLAKITESTVHVQSYDGLIPINFDFYQISFEQQGDTWLHIDQLRLNRTLLRFFIFKNRGIDITLIHPKLNRQPTIDTNTIDGINWPEFPVKKLSIKLSAYQIEIAPCIFQKNLPSLNLLCNFSFQQYGDFVQGQGKLNSPVLDNTELQTQFKGFKRLNTIALDMKIYDPKQNLTNELFNLNLPGLDGKIKIQGAPDALFAFFNPDLKTNNSFSGKFKSEVYPEDLKEDWIRNFTEGMPVLIASNFEFTNLKGLEFQSLSLDGENIDMSANGFLSRSYEFNQTRIEGVVKSTAFLKTLQDEKIEGRVYFNGELSGPLSTPQTKISFVSKSLSTPTLSAEKVKGELLSQIHPENLKGSLSLEASLNQNPFKLQTEYTFKDKDHFNFEKFALNFGQNNIESSFMANTSETYHGTLDVKLENLSLFSPFIGRAIHGSAFGTLSVKSGQRNLNLPQHVSVDIQGDYLQFGNLEMRGYNIQSEGVVVLKDLYTFDGQVDLSSQELIYDRYSFTNASLALSPHNQTSPYLLQTEGDITIQSRGQIIKNNEEVSLFVQTLSGQLMGEVYSLNESVDFTFTQKECRFTPITLNLGSGMTYLELDFKEEILTTKLEKFPVKVLSLVVPNFDIEGYLNIDGTFSHLNTKMEGELTGSAYQLTIGDKKGRLPYRSQFEFALKGDKLIGNANFYETYSDQGEMSFEVPMKLRFYPLLVRVDQQAPTKIDLEYKGDFNSFFQMLLPQNHLLEGNTQISLKLRGSLSKPSVQGEASIEKGYYENLYMGLVLKNLSTKLMGKGERLEIESLTAQDEDGGKVQAKGSISLNQKTHYPLQVHVNLQKGKIIQFDFLEAAFNGDFYLSGTLKKAKLEGDLDVTQANITIPNYFGSNLPKLNVTYLYPNEKNCLPNQNLASPSIPLTFDLRFNVKDTASLKGRGLDTNWSGSFDIKGTSQSPQFKGKLKNVEGSFVFAGRVLNLTEGIIQFDGDILEDTRINLDGTTNVHSTLINANLKGPILGPKLTFRSDPPYSQTEILSLILFNEPVQKLTPFQAVALTHSLSTLSGSYLGPDIVDKVRRGIGVDQLTFGSSIEQEGGDYTTIQVGKYITRNVLVTLNRPLTIGTSPFIITAHVRGGFQIQTYFDENEISKILIQWKLSY